METRLVKSKGGWKATAKLEASGFDSATLASNATNIWTEAVRRRRTARRDGSEASGSEAAFRRLPV